MEPLISNKVKGRKGKVVIIVKADGKEIIGKLLLKWKLKCLCYFKTLIELIKAFDFKKELKKKNISIL